MKLEMTVYKAESAGSAGKVWIYLREALGQSSLTLLVEDATPFPVGKVITVTLD